MELNLGRLLAELGGPPLSESLQGELEGWAGLAALEQGQLEQAAALFEAAAGHLATAPAATPARTELANRLQLLARAWLKQGRPERAEQALRQALPLAPARSRAALAQHLQRQQRPGEAIQEWREVIRVEPGEANPYLSLARLYQQQGQPERALTTYLELIEASPAGKNYLIAAQRLDELAPVLPPAPEGRRVRIALLGNATLDHLQSYLKVECYRAGLRPEFYQGGFDQYTQELLNPHSGLYAFGPEVLVLAIHPSRLFPRLHAYSAPDPEELAQETEAGLQTVQNLLDHFTRHSPAMVLLHNMVIPHYPALGTYDWREPQGQVSRFQQINQRLAELVRTGYRNVYLLDEEKIQARRGKSQATDPRLWFTARLGWSEAVLPDLAGEYLRYLRPLKALGRKCIVLDLDNTLWGGVVGEDGVNGLKIGAEAPGNAFVAFQQELLKLWQRGILLAVSSKNNPEDALAAFEHPAMVLKMSHFAATRINWQPKEVNLREIARELNIGLDSLVFLDDNPVERARVRAELPQVLAPELPTDPAYYRQALLQLGVFESLALTTEDRQRNQMYAEQQARQSFEQNFSGGSVEDYLAGLGITVSIEPANPANLPRIAQLTGKTNQFNLTTRRYSEAQLAERQQQGYRVFGTVVTDRFGDNGLTGVAIAGPARPGDPTVWEIDTLLLSCRVMGRGVETALLAFLAEQARQNGAQLIEGWFRPTAKNDPARDCYQRHGFERLESLPDGSERWGLNLTGQPAAIAVPAWLSVRTPAPTLV